VVVSVLSGLALSALSAPAAWMTGASMVVPIWLAQLSLFSVTATATGSWALP